MPRSLRRKRVPGVPPVVPPLVGNSPTLRRPIGAPTRPSRVNSHRSGATADVAALSPRVCAQPATGIIRIITTNLDTRWIVMPHLLHVRARDLGVRRARADVPATEGADLLQISISSAGAGLRAERAGGGCGEAASGRNSDLLRRRGRSRPPADPRRIRPPRESQRYSQ